MMKKNANPTPIDATTPQPRRKKHVSERQLAANCANAQKSTGPVTEEGKRIARYNNLQHGLTAVSVCFPFEDMAEYEADRAEFYAVTQPANIIERAVVDDLAASLWRRRRTIRNENGCVRAQIVQKHDELRTTYDRLSPDIELSLGVQSLGDESKCLDRIGRHEARLQRHFYTALRMLIQLRRNPLFPAVEPRPPEICQDEPIPEIEQRPMPAASEPEPIGNATAPNTIVLAAKKAQDEPIPNTEHPAALEPEPIWNATAPNTIVLAPKNAQDEPIPNTEHRPQLKERTMAAGTEPPLADSRNLPTNHQPLTTFRVLVKPASIPLI